MVANNNYRPGQGRLHEQKGWVAIHNQQQWFQVNLGSWTKVTRVSIQGREDAAQWLTKFKLAYSYDGVFYRDYKEEGDYTKVTIYCGMLRR